MVRSDTGVAQNLIIRGINDEDGRGITLHRLPKRGK
jgi:hypothetical protein